MNEYLKNISGIDASGTSVSLFLSPGNGSSILELAKQPPVMTSSSINEQDNQQIQDNAKYLLPQKIKLRKYNLKKG